MSYKSAYTKELADAICEAVSTQTRPLEDILKDDERFPRLKTLLEWRRNYPYFAEQFKRAKEAQCELYAEQTLQIADRKHTYHDKEGNERVDSGAVAWQTIQIKARQWYASKLFSKQFGSQASEQAQEAAGTVLEALSSAIKNKTEDKSEDETR